MRRRWELSDLQWELIEPLLRPKWRTDGRGRPCQDARAVLNSYTSWADEGQAFQFGFYGRVANGTLSIRTEACAVCVNI